MNGLELVGLYSMGLFTLVGLILGTWYAWRITCELVCVIILPRLRDWKSSLKMPVSETCSSLKTGMTPIRLMKIGPTFNNKNDWNWRMLGIWIVFYEKEPTK